ncbi:uncharacterized protein LOC142504571 [Primulina tabacum]|uniref:uncharacterized protein LOC142504571 n=1 Tax=Primulina tabacum TaxID=48773 RepID=UPI003F5A7D01
MGCGESKHAVATANTAVTKSMSKRSDSNKNAPPLQNASNEPANVKENEIPGAVFIKKEAETTEKENTLSNQENIENGESAEGGEGNPKTSSDKTKEGHGAGGEEAEKLNSCDHFPRHFFSPTSKKHEVESIASMNDPATENEEGLKLEDAGNQVITNTINDNKVTTSVGEEKTHVEEKESGNNATSTTDTKTN